MSIPHRSHSEGTGHAPLPIRKVVRALADCLCALAALGLVTCLVGSFHRTVFLVYSYDSGGGRFPICEVWLSRGTLVVAAGTLKVPPAIRTPGFFWMFQASPLRLPLDDGALLPRKLDPSIGLNGYAGGWLFFGREIELRSEVSWYASGKRVIGVPLLYLALMPTILLVCRWIRRRRRARRGFQALSRGSHAGIGD